MTSEEIVKALREDCKTCSESLICENGTNLAGLYCANKDAADLIERMTADVADLRKELEWKDMVIALAQRKQVEAEEERDALREKQRWIPVTERLPERDVQVLGWYKDNPFSQYRPEVVAWNGNGWVFVYAHRYVTNVTHWMPLPKAPEEGDT